MTEKPHRIPPGLMKNQDRFEKWKDKKEIIEQRTGNSKTYLNQDGSKTAVVFMEPVHIKDLSGSCIEIDNRLVPDTKAGSKSLYRNKRGIYQVAFSGEGQQNGKIMLSKDNISLEITVKGTEGEDMVVRDSQVLYPGTGGDIDFLYTAHNTAVKEDIILYNYSDNNTFTYEVDVKGAGDLALEQGVIRITAKNTKEEVFVLAAPYMEDKEGVRSHSLALNLEKEKGKYIITLTADRDWLKAPERVYPVIIDPTIYLKGRGQVWDTYVQEISGSVDQQYADMIYVGFDDGIASKNEELFGTHKDRTRGFIEFDLPSDINSQTNIASATLYLYKYTNWSSQTRYVEVSRVTENISTPYKWTHQPASSSPKIATAINERKGWYTWDIKQIVETWLAGSNNYGLALKMTDEDAQADCFESTQTSRGSYRRPYVEITYDAPAPPPGSEDLELVLERNNIMKNGTAYGRNTFSWSGSSDNRVSIDYRLMPDNISGSITRTDVTSFEWETRHYSPDQDKIYWIEAEITVEEWIQPPPIVDEEGNEIEQPGYYEEAEHKSMSTAKFLVYQVQPGDTIRRIAKHYLEDGSRSTEIKEINKLTTEKLTVGQRLFILTEKAEPYNYKQPETITSGIELKDMVSGTNPLERMT